jgi:hypothetical protein
MSNDKHWRRIFDGLSHGVAKGLFIDPAWKMDQLAIIRERMMKL